MMNYTIRGEKLDVTDSIKDYVITKVDRMEKYFDEPSKVNVKVILSVRGREQKVEITLSNINFDLRAEVSHSDLYAAIDLAVDKLEGQMRKYKSKIMSKSRIEIVYDDEVIDDEPIEEIVKRKKVYLKPMHEEEAILQMELLNHDFFMFKNIDEDCISVLYRRKDGKFGILNSN